MFENSESKAAVSVRFKPSGHRATNAAWLRCRMTLRLTHPSGEARWIGLVGRHANGGALS
jgi:hypothetical protein